MSKPNDKKEYLINKRKALQEKIKHILSEINKFDVVMTLLSIDEAFSLEYQDVLRSMETSEKQNSIRLLGYKNIIQHRYVVKQLIEYVLNNCENNNLSLDRIPRIDIFSKFGDDSNIKELGDKILQSKYDIRTDGYYYTAFPLSSGNVRGVRYYFIKEVNVIDINFQIFRTFELFKNYYEKMVYETVLRNKLNFEIINEHEIKYDEQEMRKIFEKEGIHPRNLGIIQTKFPYWKMDIERTAKNATFSGPLGSSSHIHRKFAKEEIETIIGEFAKLPDFKSIFEKEYSLSFDNYAAIVKEIILSTYNTGLTQAIVPKSRLITRLGKLTNATRKEIEKILNGKTWKVGDNLFEKPLIFDGINYHYTHSMLVHGMFSNFHKCYDELIDNNLKGPELENECRTILNINSYNTISDRFIINEQYMPSEVSMYMFGHIKKGTDIDVIGIKNDTLLIIECKLRKLPKKRKLSLEHDLEMNYADLKLKAEWIVDNFEKFRRIGTEQGYSIPQECKFLIPIFVSDYVKPQNPNYNAVNVSEFEEITKKIQNPINTPVHIIKLDSDIELRFPSYEIIRRNNSA